MHARWQRVGRDGARVTISESTRRGLLVRPRVLELLDAPTPLVLVHGPSGGGKSVALRQHAEQVPGTVLVEQDATPDEARAGLDAAVARSSALVVDAADQLPHEVMQEVLAAVVDGRVPRLVVSGRGWPRAVRDVQGRLPLTVVDRADLLLTPDEVRRLVVEQGGEMSAAEAVRVVRRTGGVAGLVALGIVRGRTVWWSGAALREAVTVRAQQHVPPDLRRHVVFVPLLQVYSGTAVRGLAGEDADDLLALLDRLGVGPRDWRGRPPWQSVHADLARALGVAPQQVAQDEPEVMAGVVHALHAQGAVLDAARQGLRSRSWSALAEVLDAEWRTVLAEDPALLQAALSGLPPGLVRRSASLDALTRALRGELVTGADTAGSPRDHALRAVVAMATNRHAGRLDEALAQAESAETIARAVVDGRPGTSRTVPWEQALAVTHAGITRFMTDDLRRAAHDFSTALHAEAGTGPDARLDASHKLALTYAMQGDLREARRLRQEVPDAEGHPWLADHVGADGHVVDAFLALEALDRPGAQAALSAIALPSRQHELWFVVALLRVRIARLWGGAADALEALRLDVATHAPKDPRWLTHHVTVAAEAEANLSLGRGTRAAALLARTESRHPLVELARGRMHLLAGDVRQASLSLARCEGPHAYRRVRVEALVLRARALQAAGDEPAAQALLRQALVQAEAGGVRSPFAAVGDRTAAWLGRVPGLRAVLDRLDETGAHTVDVPGLQVVPLSPREQEVLELIAGGLGVDQVAERLVLSRNTVKTHVRRLYRSLGVSSWSAAVERGHELGLLDD